MPVVTKRSLSAAGKLQGIIPPLITPLKARDQLDHGGLERLLEHVINGGVSGVFVLGTTGEGPALNYSLRRELIQRVCRQTSGRVPVLVGITDTSYVEALAIARYAADYGVHSVVASAPYYMPPDQDELAQYMEQLARELPLPLFLYNIPPMTKVVFQPATLKRLSGLQNIIGVKDSSGDMNYFRRVVALKKQRPDWSVLVGWEHQLVEATHLGGDGGVNAGANYDPQLFVDLYEALRNGDIKKEKKLQQRVLLLGKVYRVGHSAAGVVQGLKCACAQKRFCREILAAPFVPLVAPERKKVIKILRQLRT